MGNTHWEGEYVSNVASIRMHLSVTYNMHKVFRWPAISVFVGYENRKHRTKSPAKEEPMNDRQRRRTQVRTALLLASVYLALISARPRAALSEPAQENPSGEKEVIRKMLVAGDVAWNKGNLEGFVDNYWNSPDTTLFSGKEVTKGWQAILERYQKRYQGEGKEMGHLTSTEVEIDMLGPESAFVRGRWVAVFKKEKALGGLFTLILKKTPVGWRIVHDHASIG